MNIRSMWPHCLYASPQQLFQGCMEIFKSIASNFNRKKADLSMASNKAAYLDEAGKPLRVGDADMPKAGPDDIVMK